MAGAFQHRDYQGVSNLRSAATIAFDWLVIAAAIWASESVGGPLAWLIAAFVIGGRMMALVEVLGHDAAHEMLFTPRQLNRRLDFLYFVPFGDTWEGYREHHLPHHARLMDERDPALQDFRRWGLYDPGRGFWWACVVRPFLALETLHDLASFARALRDDPTTRRKMLAFWIPAAAAITWFDGWWLFLVYWLVPLLWIKPGLEFWSEVSDHFAVEGAATRSSRGLVQRLFLNPHGDGWHGLHHRFPRIPCFALPRAHRDYAAVVPDPLPVRTFAGTVREVWRAKAAQRRATESPNTALDVGGVGQ